MGNGTDSNSTAIAYYFQLGYNNVQMPGVPELFTSMGAVEATRWVPFFGPNRCDVPAGTALQVRGTASGTAEVWAGGFGVYGV